LSLPFDKYELVVGLEIHIQLNTKSKLFAPDLNQFGSDANTNVSFITLAHPGILPKLNKQAVAKAIKTGLATNCAISEFCYFDRKNYNYPDLPKGFQTTQDNLPICKSGWLNVASEDGERKIRIHRIHMEEDAGKSIHDLDEQFSFIDLNRAGTPLLELVTEPDIRSAEEASNFVANIRQIVQYIDVCDGNMQEGSLRCDANVSIRLKGEEQLNTRVEIKNLNSVKFVKQAIEFEFKRQVKAYEQNEKIVQSTVGFDSKTGKTFVQREKEMMHDYRYFPEPDLAPLQINKEWIAEIKASLPLMPAQAKQKLVDEFALTEIDAGVIAAEKQQFDYFIKVAELTPNFKAISNWLAGPIKSHCNKNNIPFNNNLIPAIELATLINKIEANEFSFGVGKDILSIILKKPKTTVENAFKLLNLQTVDQNQVELLVNEVLSEFPDKVAEFRGGRKGLLGFFIGQLKRKDANIDPKQMNEWLLKKLNT